MKFRFTVDIDNVDYAQIIRAVLPYVNKADIPLPSAVLDAAKNSAKLTEAAVRFADKHGVDANISGLRLEEKL